MKITVNKFAGIDSRTVNVDKLYIMEEDNGYGKSSFLKAINFCLSGDYPTNPIYNNGNVCQVDIETNGTTLSRVLKKTETGYQNIPYINGRKCTGKAFEECMTNNLMSGKACKILCNPLSLSEISEQALGDLIMNVINKNIDSEKLRELAENMTDEQYEYLLDIMSLAKVDKNVIALSDIGKLYNETYQQRQINNRNIKAFGTLQLTEPPMHTEKELQDKLADIMKREAVVEAQKKNIILYNNNALKVKRINDQIRDIEERISTFAPTKENPVSSASLKLEEQNILEAYINCEKQISSFQAEKNTDFKLIQELDKTTCPLSEKIHCTANRADLKESLIKECDNITAKIAKLEEEKKELSRKKEDIRKRIDEAVQYEESEKTKKSLKETVNTLKESIPEIGEAPEPVIGNDYTAEKESVQKQIREVIQYNDIKNKIAQKDKLTAVSNIYSELLAMLSPNGKVKLNFWKLIIAPLENRMNSTIGAMKNANIKFNTNNGFELLYSVNGSQYICFNSLSGGEKIIATLAVYHVINQLYGNKILLIDDLDRVDDTTYGKVYEFIGQIKDNYDAIICARVKHTAN